MKNKNLFYIILAVFCIILLMLLFIPKHKTAPIAAPEEETQNVVQQEDTNSQEKVDDSNIKEDVLNKKPVHIIKLKKLSVKQQEAEQITESEVNSEGINSAVSNENKQVDFSALKTEPRSKVVIVDREYKTPTRSKFLFK